MTRSSPRWTVSFARRPGQSRASSGSTAICSRSTTSRRRDSTSKCIDAVRTATRALGLPHREMVSGAGHDAIYLARVAPTSMIFVPCKDGLSHNEIEDARPEHLEAGANVLLHAMLARALDGRSHPMLPGRNMTDTLSTARSRARRQAGCRQSHPVSARRGRRLRPRQRAPRQVEGPLSARAQHGAGPRAARGHRHLRPRRRSAGRRRTPRLPGAIHPRRDLSRAPRRAGDRAQPFAERHPLRRHRESRCGRSFT